MSYLKHLVIKFFLIALISTLSSTCFADNPVDDLHYKEAQKKILEALYVESGLEADIQKTLLYITERYSNKFTDVIMPVINITFKKRIEVRYEF